MKFGKSLEDEGNGDIVRATSASPRGGRPSRGDRTLVCALLVTRGPHCIGLTGAALCCCGSNFRIMGENKVLS